MPEFVLGPAGAAEVDARLERWALLDVVMEEAGRAAADITHASFPAGRVLLLAGSGANGGDALVAARHLVMLGRDVTVLASPARHALTRLNRRRLRAVGVQPSPLTVAALRRAGREAAVIVDGLLGTGFRPPLRSPVADVIAAVNAAGLPVVSLDLPSGVSAGGTGMAHSVQATRTVTLMGWKPALLFGEWAARAGEVTLVPLRVPPAWVAAQALAQRLMDGEVGALLPVRRADAHKGTAGAVWVLGGHPGTVGAPLLSALGAFRAGAGLVTVHSLTDVPMLYPEVMVRRHAAWPGAAQAWGERRPDAVAVGMGLGPQAPQVARQVLAWDVPTVLDADALQPELLGAGHGACVWTPHPGEAARLLGTGTADVVRDPLSAARALQERLGGAVVLKGGPSVIAHPGGLSVSRGGHPGMATAGMGDTLAGVIAALLAQGLGAAEAAVAGVRLHARAGERAAERFGYGLMAGDVAAQLGGAWGDLRGAARAEC